MKGERGKLIDRLRSALRRFERIHRVLMEDDDCCCGLTTTQCHPLLEIDKVGHSNLGDLAQTLGIDSSTMSRTIDGLVRAGLIDRRPDAEDRRRVVLTLTTVGKRLCDDINGRNNVFYGGVLDRLPEAGRASAVSAFEDLVSALERALSGRSECCGGGEE
jgi:DNA-binding MarR family transcriptional regulator